MVPWLWVIGRHDFTRWVAITLVKPGNWEANLAFHTLSWTLHSRVSWRLSNLFSHRLTEIFKNWLHYRLRWSAFLRLKTNLQNYNSSELWDLDRLPCFVTMYYLLTSKWGRLYGNGVCENLMLKWSPLWHSSSRFAEWCLDEVQSQEPERCRCEYFHRWDSTQPFSQDDVQVNDLSSTSFQRVSYESKTLHPAEVFRTFPTYQRQFHLSYVEANVCTWLNLFANSRHRLH